MLLGAFPNSNTWHIVSICFVKHFKNIQLKFQCHLNSSAVQMPFEFNSNICDFSLTKLVQTNFIKSQLIHGSPIIFYYYFWAFISFSKIPFPLLLFYLKTSRGRELLSFLLGPASFSCSFPSPLSFSPGPAHSPPYPFVFYLPSSTSVKNRVSPRAVKAAQHAAGVPPATPTFFPPPRHQPYLQHLPIFPSSTQTSFLPSQAPLLL